MQGSASGDDLRQEWPRRIGRFPSMNIRRPSPRAGDIGLRIGLACALVAIFEQVGHLHDGGSVTDVSRCC